MLHREYNSKVAWPGTKQMESYSLAVTKRLWFFSPNINSFHTVAHNYPHDQGPVDTSQSPLTTACTFHLWGLLSPKAELLTYSVFLLSSLAPFLTTLLLSRYCSSLSFPHHELFFLNRLNIGNAAGYQQWEFLTGKKPLHSSSSIYSQKSSGNKLPLSYPWPLGLNVARGWEGLEGRTGKLTFLSSTWGNKTFTPPAGGAGWVRERAQEELGGTCRGLSHLCTSRHS